MEGTLPPNRTLSEVTPLSFDVGAGGCACAFFQEGHNCLAMQSALGTQTGFDFRISTFQAFSL